MIVSQHTPNSAATWDTDGPAHPPAVPLRTRRGPSSHAEPATRDATRSTSSHHNPARHSASGASTLEDAPADRNRTDPAPRSRWAIVRLGPGPAPAASLNRDRGLDGDHEFVGSLSHLEHPESVQSQHDLGQASSVTHRQGPPSCCCREQLQMMARPLAPSEDPQLPVAPDSNRKSRLMLRRWMGAP